MISRSSKVGTVLSTLSLVAALGAVDTAYAGHVACGDIILQSTVLDTDLGPCPSFGIVIGADNITLDLNGHRVVGTPNRGDGAGVYVQRRSGVTVRNGTVTNFDIGVLVEGGAGNTVTGIGAFDNLGGGANVIGGDGISIESSSNNRIVGNKTQNNGPYSGIGVYSRVDSNHPRSTTGPSNNNLIENNEVIGNVAPRPGGTPESTDNDGIRIENDAVGTIIRGNRVSRSGLDGIALFADTQNSVVQGNTVEGSGFFRTSIRRGSGIIVFNRSNGNRIENNFVTRNADSGIAIQGPFSGIPGSLNNQILYNTSVGNSALPPLATTSPAFAPGTSADLQDRNPNCDNNFWFGNRYRTATPPCTTNGGQQV